MLGLAVVVVAGAVTGFFLTRSPAGKGRSATTSATVVGHGSAGHHRGSGAVGSHVTGHTGHKATVSTSLGPYGVVSSAIVAENKRPGTTAWRLTPPPASGTIEGFANTTYAAAGQKVTLYVSTTAPTFKVVAYRMGYYQGKGARQVWTSPEEHGTVQPTCPVTPGTNMVSCDNWSPSLTFTVTDAFVQGDYLLKLIGSGNQQGYVQLTVWDPTSTAAYLVVARSLTEQGWNTFGGYSYYQGQGPCTLGQTGSYPPCNRARVVSFDRPYTTGQGASDFLGDEYPLVRFMERQGLDVAYVTDITVDEHPTLVLHHKAYLSLGHDETWTWTERQAVQDGLAHGVNVAFMGAAPLVRHARLQPSALGPDREEVDYRNSTEDPLAASGPASTVTGNTFATPPTSAPVTQLVGGEYSGYLDQGVNPVPLVVQQATSWFFKGTGLAAGASVPAVIDSDINHVNPTAGPADLEVLAHSPVALTEAYTNQGTWGGDTYADTTYYTTPTSRGGVFQAGTTNWIDALNSCAATSGTCRNAALETMTGNLFRVFGQGPAGNTEPSVNNLASVTPPGS